jgi:hypothetical protein
VWMFSPLHVEKDSGLVPQDLSRLNSRAMHIFGV